MHMRSGRLAAVLVSAFVVVSCQSAPQPTPSSGSTKTPIASTAPTASTAPAPPALPPTSEKLIAAALASGSITQEQSLVDRALALFDSPGLPEQFRSSVIDMEAAGDLLRDIDAAESTLSPAALAQLAPYRVRPSDPASIYSSAPHARVGLSGVARAAGNGVTADVGTAWQSLPAAGGKARVWVKGSATASGDLSKYAAQVSQVWAAYPGIFTYPLPDQPSVPSKEVNPDSAIDIYFVNVGDIDPRRAACVANPSDPGCLLAARVSGYAVRVLPYPGHTSSGALVIDAGRSPDQITDTIAHELAHAAQFAYDRYESSWLMESTATWVAFKVDKKLAIEPKYQYDWLPYTFDGLDQTLTRAGDNNGNSYASWLYFLFASMEAGDGIVTQIWQVAAANGEQGADAVDQVFPFADHFAAYAVRDWNKDPVKPMYQAVDSTFPTTDVPKIKDPVQTLYGGEEQPVEVDLPPLASAYYQYDFAADVRDVTFTNGLDGTGDARVWAIKQIDGEWKAPEDWTATADQKFCRNIPEQNVSQLVLVVANQDRTDDLTFGQPPKMVAGTAGCSGWSGTMKATGSWGTAGNPHGTGTSTFTGIWMIDKSWDGGCDPTSTDACPSLLRPTGTISWSWDSHITDTTGKPTCDVTTSGALPAGQEKYPEWPAQALYMRSIAGSKIQYWGGGGFNPPDLTCPNGIVGGTIPSSFFEIDQRASTANGPSLDGSTCGNSNWQIDSTADTITGSCWAYNFPNNREKFEWSLTRLGPAPGS